MVGESVDSRFPVLLYGTEEKEPTWARGCFAHVHGANTGICRIQRRDNQAYWTHYGGNRNGGRREPGSAWGADFIYRGNGFIVSCAQRIICRQKRAETNGIAGIS